jgi:hypothetical protein
MGARSLHAGLISATYQGGKAHPQGVVHACHNQERFPSGYLLDNTHLVAHGGPEASDCSSLQQKKT